MCVSGLVNCYYYPYPSGVSNRFRTLLCRSQTWRVYLETMDGWRSMRHARLHLCVDLMHTQGAALFSWLSYITIIMRVARELPDVEIAAQLPDPTTRPPFGFGMGIESLFTADSLQQLASEAGFSWAEHNRTACSWANCDARIADGLHVHRGELFGVNRTLESAGLAWFQRFNARSRDVNHTLETWLANVWRYLREETVAQAASQPRAPALRVHFGIMHWTTGPLAYAHLALPAETPVALATLQLAGRLKDDPRAVSRPVRTEEQGCTYVYLRRAITRLNYTRTMFRSRCAPTREPSRTRSPRYRACSQVCCTVSRQIGFVSTTLSTLLPNWPSAWSPWRFGPDTATGRGGHAASSSTCALAPQEMSRACKRFSSARLLTRPCCSPCKLTGRRCLGSAGM